MLSQRYSYGKLLGSLTIVIVVLIFVSSNCRAKFSSVAPLQCTGWLQLANEFRQCVLTSLSSASDLWRNFDGIVALCLHQLPNLPIIFLENTDDTKALLLRAANGQQAPCQHVTIGIGGDIEAEKQLQRYTWHCTFVGVDPGNDTGAIFKEIGQVYRLAVSNETARKKISVLQHSSFEHTYKEQVALTISLVDFFKMAKLVPVIETMFLDAEGAEYALLPLLQQFGAVSKAGYIICQINAELHGPITEYALRDGKEFDQLLKTFFNFSHFIPAWVQPPKNHMRMFLLNYKAQECINRFYFPWCNT